MSGSDSSFDEIIREKIFIFHGPVTVLDIGPGSGKMGRLVKEANAKNRVVGIEIYPGYAAGLEEFGYDEVIIGSASKLLDPPLVDRKWDAVIFGDVIEHMPHSLGADLLDCLCIRSKRIFVKYPVHDSTHNLYQAGDNSIGSEAHRSIWCEADFAKFDHQLLVSESNTAMRLAIIKGYA